MRGILWEMEGRSPLGIAIESLRDAREAARAGAFVQALELLDAGLAALGPHYERQRLLDESGLKLALAAGLRARGELAEAFTAADEVLDDRIAHYAGRSGETC